MISNADFTVIAALDLDPIKVKLMHKESGEGWSLEQANAVESEYRRFLYLMKMYPHEQTAPLFDVDTFWHYHILDTMKYEADCAAIFGYFPHHFPYIGLRGEDDEAAHQRVGARMQALYEATFGESYVRQQAAQVTAWSGATAKATATPPQTAWSGATAKTAWSGATAKTAWSGATAPRADGKSAGQTAWSGATATTAWSGATAKTAWSGATVRSADGAGVNGSNTTSAANGQTAWSGATLQTVAPAATGAARTAWSGSVNQPVGPLVDRFYSARPGLRAAA